MSEYTPTTEGEYAAMRARVARIVHQEHDMTWDQGAAVFDEFMREHDAEVLVKWLQVSAERDALQAKLDAVRKLAESTDRGIGYRVSGDHSTWGEYHEGRSALGGEIQSILDGEETS